MPLLVVTEAFADFSTGHPEIYNPGRLVDGDDPVVRGRETCFEQADVAASRSRVEQATAAPGERRSLTQPRRRTKKAPAKKAPAKKAPAKKAPAKKAPAKPGSSEQV